MELHRLNKQSETLFATTNYDNFLSQCENLYHEVSDDTSPTYTDKNELPQILESMGYTYTVSDMDSSEEPNPNMNNDIILLFNKLAYHNARYTFENGSTLLYACDVLIKEHYEAVQKYIHGMSGHVSLLEQIIGDNGIEQLTWHKEFLNMYDIAIY